MRRLTVVLSLLLAVAALPVAASVPLEGSFEATRACEAYVSKNRRSNPDGARLAAGSVYPLLEANRAREPDWYRVQVQAAAPPARWVARECGEVRSVSEPEVAPPARGRCSVPGLADGFKLALTWQPAFCETRPEKPECAEADADARQGGGFSLHGLWPERVGCGAQEGYYAWCGEGRKREDFCDHPRLSLHPAVRRDLEQVMPSAAAGSCLQRHEWFKHGTCQTAWDASGYYAVSADLTRQFNRSGIAAFMARHVGREVTRTAFLEAVDAGLGPGAHRRLQLRCDGRNLLEVRINLPRTIPPSADLRELVAAAPEGFRSDCGRRIRIDPPGLAALR